jgi:hypothetical protein
MSSIINFSMKNASGGYDKYTMSINDKQDEYGNNASVWIAQSKEERETKTPKKFVGNGKVQWTDGTIIKAEFVERTEQPKSTGMGMQSTSQKLPNTDLPF